MDGHIPAHAWSQSYSFARLSRVVEVQSASIDSQKELDLKQEERSSAITQMDDEMSSL